MYSSRSTRIVRRISCGIGTFDTDHASIEADETYDWWMIFNDTGVQQSYEYFRNSSEFSIIHFMLIAILFTILLIITVVNDTVFSYSIQPKYLFAYYLKLGSSLAFIALVLVPLWVIVFALVNRSQVSRNIRLVFEFSVLVGGSLTIGTTLFALAIGAEVHSTFSDTVAVAVIFPSIVTTLIFRHPNMKTLILGWLICFISLVVSFVISNKQGIFIFLASLLLAYQNYSIELHTLCLFLKELSKSRLTESIIKLESQKGQKYAEDLRHMIGNVAHDLKIPTQSFAVCLEQLELSIQFVYNITMSSVNIQIHSILQDMSENIFQHKASNLFMSMMINRTIDFTKASYGNVLSPQLSTVDVLETLSWPLACMRSMQTTIPFNLETPPQDLAKYIITDSQWLQENILCLISNAVKYSIGGSIDILIILLPENHHILEQPSPPMIQFEVEDHGIGIPVDIRHQLFAPFKQAQRLAGGTGLGLYSMLKRMEALKGSCGVEDRRDGQQGSLFWFKVPYLPHCLSTSTSYRSNQQQSRKNNTRNDYDSDIEQHVNLYLQEDWEENSVANFPSSLNILVVDDSVPILKTLGMALKKMGHVVQTAGNGAEALVYLIEKGEVYDIVVMDLQMPVMDGIEAVRRLRAHESGLVHNTSFFSPRGSISGGMKQPHQLVIGSSANCDEVTRKEALAIGMDDFLPKPYPTTTLVDKIYEMILIKYNINHSS